jgi:capsular exopolysaccharide synthesis family protein
MEIRKYLFPLRKWWWLIAIATIVAAGVSFLSLREQPDLYLSHATLLVGSTIEDPNPTGTTFTQSQQLAKIYADLARRDPVRRAVMETLQLSTLPNYQITEVPNTQLIEVSVSDTDPVRAQAVANSLATALVELTPSTVEPGDEQRDTFVREQLTKLQAQIQETDAEIEAKQEELGELFSAQDIEQVQTEINALQAKLSSLQSNYASLLATSLEGASNTITIFESATLPRRPVDPQTVPTVLIAAAIGFTLASLGAYTIEYLDDNVGSQEDVERYTGLATLTTIATMEFEENESGLVARDRPRSPDAEAFRMLRTGVRFANNGTPPRSLLVTSPKQGDGKSLTVANLAITMAQSEKRVLIIDTDFHRPTQHKLFRLSNDKGLADLLLDRTDSLPQRPFATRLDSFVMNTCVKNVSLLSSGRAALGPSGFSEPMLVQTVLDVALTRFDMVIVDSPPCLAFTETVELSSYTDGVLLVIWAGRTSRKELRQATQRLQMAHAKLLGVVLNRLSKVEESYYYIEKYYALEQDEKGARTAARDSEASPENS